MDVSPSLHFTLLALPRSSPSLLQTCHNGSQQANQQIVVNNARALRVGEIITDYRNIQQRISQIRTSPSAEEYNEVGFALLRQCENDARALLSHPFAGVQDNPDRDEEQVKLQLRR